MAYIIHLYYAQYQLQCNCLILGGVQKMSNELNINLPLDTRGISLPPNELRSDDDDLYKEYIEVQEGSDDHGKYDPCDWSKQYVANESAGLIG